jgi:hypothetical protein
MARTYANVDVGIWDDPEFCGLSAGAQRTYFMLITQTDITACGSLALTLRRWSKTCLEQDLTAWLAELEDARFVVIDEDSEELLVRTFVKWDGGYKHAKRVLAVTAYARAIRSRPLRDAVADELAKLGVSIANPLPTDTQPIANREAIGSGRSVVNVGDQESTPHSTLQEGEPPPPESDVEPSPFCSRHPNGTEKPCGPCGSAKLRHGRWEKRDARRRAELEQARNQAVLDEIAAARKASTRRSA